MFVRIEKDILLWMLYDNRNVCVETLEVEGHRWYIVKSVNLIKRTYNELNQTNVILNYIKE